VDRIADPEILPDTEPPLLKEEDEVSRHEHKEYLQAVADWSKNRSLAQRVLSGEETAYLEALSEFSFLDELTLLGAEIEVGLHTLRKIEVTFRANEEAVIPGEIKSLTSTGKVSNKAVPRVRFREIYQDHVCSSMLRVAREMFAVLPIEELILNTRAQVFDSATGIHTIAAIYSVRIPREGLVGLNYESLDPSDAIERFNHAGDFSASRRSGAFQGVTPLTFEEQEFDSSDLDVLARKAKDVRLALLESVGANSA
jgi:hypothetical protein